MVKAYLRYELQSSWGVIASSNCNVCYDRSGRHLLAASLENVSLWNVKQAALVRAGRGCAGGRELRRRQAHFIDASLPVESALITPQLACPSDRL